MVRVRAGRVVTAMSAILAALVPLPLAVTASPIQAFISGTTTPLTTPTVTAIPVNGIAPFSYAWAYSSGDVGLTCNSPGVASTSWTANLPPAQEKISVWRCTVTDSTPGVPQTAFVSVTVDIRRN